MLGFSALCRSSVYRVLLCSLCVIPSKDRLCSLEMVKQLLKGLILGNDERVRNKTNRKFGFVMGQTSLFQPVRPRQLPSVLSNNETCL